MLVETIIPAKNKMLSQITKRQSQYTELIYLVNLSLVLFVSDKYIKLIKTLCPYQVFCLVMFEVPERYTFFSLFNRSVYQKKTIK